MGSVNNTTAIQANGLQSALAGDDKKQNVAIMRSLSSKVLLAMRRGKSFSIACREILVNTTINTTTLYNFTYKRESYRRLKEKMKSAPSFLDDFRRLGKRSKQWINETEFQNHIEDRLVELGVKYTREYRIGPGRDRVDFKIEHFGIETKISSTTAESKKLIGQMMLYRSSGLSPVLLIPDDIILKSWLVDAFSNVNMQIVQASAFGEWLVNSDKRTRYVAPMKESKQMKQLRKIITCACCGNQNQRSLAPSGRPRSYCIECEQKILSMMWSPKELRWIEAHPNNSRPILQQASLID